MASTTFINTSKLELSELESQPESFFCLSIVGISPFLNVRCFWIHGCIDFRHDAGNVAQDRFVPAFG